jgi:hypothetical protein
MLKLGRALDQPGLEDLMNNYEIKGDGDCGEYIFNGISHKEHEDLKEKKINYKRLFSETNQELIDEQNENNTFRKELKVAKKRIVVLQTSLISKGEELN